MSAIEGLLEEIKEIKLQLEDKEIEQTDLDNQLILAKVTIEERLDRLANGENEITALLVKLLKYEKRLFAKEEEMRKLREAELQGKCLVIPIILVILVMMIFISI